MNLFFITKINDTRYHQVLNEFTRTQNLNGA